MKKNLVKNNDWNTTTDTGENGKNNGITEIVFILDKSGSMAGLEQDTIGGFNSMIERQKKDKECGETFVSTVLFDDKSFVLHDRIPLEEVPVMTEKDYYVGASTALLDAIGGAVEHIGVIHKYARPEDRPSKTMFVITTDGQENSSRKYTFDSIKRLVERKQEEDKWEFIFIGANMDAITEAANFGIKANRAVNYCHDKQGTRAVYESVGMAMKKARSAKSSAQLAYCMESADWQEEVRKDYENRGSKKR